MDVKVLMAGKSDVQLQLNCMTLLTTSKSIILKLAKLNGAIKQSNKNCTIDCPINTTITLHHLDPNMKYTVVVDYTLGSVSIECNLQTFTTQPGSCKHKIMVKLWCCFSNSIYLFSEPCCHYCEWNMCTTDRSIHYGLWIGNYSGDIFTSKKGMSKSC